MADSPAQNDPPSNAVSAPKRAPIFYFRLLGGFCIGALGGLALCPIAFAGSQQSLPVIGGIVGALLAVARLWRLALSILLATAMGLLLIAFSPLVPWLVSAPPETDALEPCDAVVALGAGVFSDGSMGCHSRDRSLHAIELLREGYGKELVVPVAAESWGPAVHEQMSRLGLNYRIEEPGIVANTHDEAMVVAQLARARGWHRVILVTNAWHMHRAAATFRKAGLGVVRSPCADSCSDMIHPTGVGERMRAFGCWLHETVGYRVYRARGWAD